MYIRKLITIGFLSAFILYPQTAIALPSRIESSYLANTAVAVASPITEMAPHASQDKPRKVLPRKRETIPSELKNELLAQAGVPKEAWEAADFIITMESGWNSSAVNPSSGACGLVQALPCKKLGKEWHNPTVALAWGNQYAIARYGSWQNAKTFWQVHRYW